MELIFFLAGLGTENLILSRLVATNTRETDRPRVRRNWAERATSGLGCLCLTLIRSDMPNVFTRENYPHRCLQGGRQGCQEIDMKLGLKNFFKELLLQNLFKTFPVVRKYLKGTCFILNMNEAPI